MAGLHSRIRTILFVTLGAQGWTTSAGEGLSGDPRGTSGTEGLAIATGSSTCVDNLGEGTTTSTTGDALTGDSPKYDVGMGTGEGGSEPVDVYASAPIGSGVETCTDVAPPDSFDPVTQWSYGPEEQSWVTPLVGNFTDDNGDGSIDLCDMPDVILVSNTTVGRATTCFIRVLDGASSNEHFSIPLSHQIACSGTPAFGDIDNDGLPEIVAVWIDNGNYRVKAFAHEGTLIWAHTDDFTVPDPGDPGPNPFQIPVPPRATRDTGGIALHDIDADGDVAILFDHEIYAHNGVLLQYHYTAGGDVSTTTAADLDGGSTPSSHSESR